MDYHPDEALDHVVQIAAGVANQLAVAAAGVHTAAPKPGELEFGIKIDSNSTVSIARSAATGQFRVRVRWTP